MKRKNNILIFLSALFLPLMMTSCAEELNDITGDPDSKDCYGIYFPSQKGTGDLQVGPDDPKSMKFTVRRTNTRGKVSVPVTV